MPINVTWKQGLTLPHDPDDTADYEVDFTAVVGLSDTPEIVAAKCKGFAGCARAVGFQNYVFITAKGEYEIWYSDPALRVHEWCHAAFEETRHTQ